MQNAIESEDPKQYKIAKDRIGEAQALIDIYNVKIEQTRSRSLVSGDETLQTRRSIKAFEMKRAEAFTAQVDALINQIADTAGHGAGLSGSRPGQNQQRSLCRENRLLLHWIHK